MPVYNDEVYLEESINTVNNQSLKDIELICINDGSTDDSINILNRLKEKYDFIKIYNQYNQGSGKARNKGIQKAIGEYVAFLDSDDRFIDSNALEEMYNVAIKHDADMVSANLKGITVKNELVNNDDGVERFSEEGIISGKEYGIPYAFYKNIFKREFLNKYNFRFPDLKRGQDPVFLSEIITKVDLIPVLPIDLYGFRYAPTGGLSKINTFEKRWDYIKHFRESFNILKQAQFTDIFEDYKQKLFLFINHAENSSNETIYNIVQEIFKDDPDILDECETYFHIEPNEQNEDLKTIKDSKQTNLENKDYLKIENQMLESKIQLLNHKNDLLTSEIDILAEKSQTNKKLKFDNETLLNENEYLIGNNEELKNKIANFYEIIERINTNPSYLKENFDLLENKSEYYNNEYSSLIKKQHENDLIIHNIISQDLQGIYQKQKNQDKNLAIIKNKLNQNETITKLPELKRINIAYVLYGFPTLSETFILNELRWLIKNGFNVKVFSYMNPQKPVDLDFDIETYRFDENEELFDNLERLIKEHNINIMHTHFVYPTGTKFTFPIAKKLKIPFTMFAHAFDIFIKENDKINNIKEISNSEYCKGIFTLSNYHKNYLIERGVPKEKIFITRQATEYQVTPLNKENKPVKNIISISRFVEKKGLDILIQTAQLLQGEDLEFSIYGFGILEEELNNQIKNLNLKNISIKGSLNNSDEVKRVFDNSDLLVSPCKIAENGDRDGIPTVLFESMGYGVPVLTTSVSAIPEVINDCQNGFIVQPENPEELAKKIKFIMNLTPEELLKIKIQAQNDVQKISSINNTMLNVLNVWKGII